MDRFDPELQQLIKANTLGESIFNAVKAISGCTREDLHAVFNTFSSDQIDAILERFIEQNILFQMWDEYYPRVDTFPVQSEQHTIQA